MEIYVKLLNEGVLVFRPTKGIPLGESKYKLLPTETYDEENEDWEFKPGTIVICKQKEIEGTDVLIAVSEIKQT